MAVRGKRPSLRSDQADAGMIDPAFDVPENFDNGLKPPYKLNKAEREIWDGFIRRAPWLTWADAHRAYLYTCAWAACKGKPKNAHMLAQLRAMQTELGQDPVTRMRIKSKTASNNHTHEKASETGAARFFN